MTPYSEEKPCPSFATMSPQRVAALLASARVLQTEAHEGKTRPRLHGANIALLCESDADDDIALFRAAVSDLGAHLAHLRPSVTLPAKSSELPRTVHVLQRLYDALDCRGVERELVRKLAFYADIPVYHDLSSPRHPTARMSEQLDPSWSLLDRRRFVLEAALLSTIR